MKKKLLIAFLVSVLLCTMIGTTSYAGFEAKINPGDLPKAQVAELNKNYSVTWGEGKLDYVLSKVTLPKDGLLSITAKKPVSKSIGKIALDVSIYTANNEFVWNCRQEDKSAPDLIETSKIGLAAGTYYIVIDRQYPYADGEISSYKYSFVAGDCYEKEINSTKETATNIVTDKAYLGHLGSGFSNISSYTNGITEDDMDAYAITLQKGYTYKLNISGTKGTTIVNVLTKDESLTKTGGTTIDEKKKFVAPYTGTYYISVWNYSNAQYEYSFNVQTVGVAVPSTSIKKLTPAKKSVKVKWVKSTCDGYEIQYSVKSNLKKAKTKTITKGKTTSATISKLKSGKKYYVRIRAYKIVNGKKYYSKWSKIKSTTVK